MTRAVPFAQRLSQHGWRAALVTAEGEITYRDLAHRVAAARQELGAVRRLVMVAVGNAVEPIVMYLAALAAGHPVLLVPGDNGAVIESLVDAYDPDVVLRPRDGAWVLDERHQGSVHRLHPDLALLLSTSGSTGSPKLVRLSHDNVEANAASITQYLAIDDGDRAVTTLPMHYCYGLSVINSHLRCGAALVLTERSVVDDEFWDLFREHRATSFAGVPYTFELLDRIGFAEMALPSLRYVTQAGGRLAAEVVRRYAALGRRDGWELYVMYGQTEATARMAFLPPSLAEEHPHAVGVPVPGGAFRIEAIGDHDDPDVGELVYAGPNVMLGYAERPADLALGRTVDDLRTGDIARRTGAGLYEVVGRLGRHVKLFGLRLDLDRVEAALQGRGVAAMCVAAGGELVIAVERGSRVGHVRRLAAASCGLPARVVRVCELDSLPRLASGKPDYPSLSDRVAAVPPARVVADDRQPVDAAALRMLFAELLDAPDVTDDSSFVSLRGDSLSYVEMSVRLEDALGELPNGWHAMPIRDLVPAAAVAREPGRRLETSIALRAVAIVLIVASHANVFSILGGAHVLLGVAGFNFARFHLTPASRTQRLRHLTASTLRLAAPAVVWIGVMLLVGAPYSMANLMLLNGFLGPDVKGPEWHFWFVEALLYILVAVGGLLAGFSGLHRLEQRFPFGFVAALVLVGLLTRYHVVAFDVELARFKAHMVFWLFALGWAAARAEALWQRILVTGVIAVTVPGFIGNLPRELVIVAGLCLLVWASSIRVPKVVASAAAVLAASSLYIYLTHWQVYPRFDDGHELLATIVSVAVGIAYWRVMQPITTRLTARIAAAAPAAAPAAVRDADVPPVDVPTPRHMGDHVRA